jgi:beta-mannanase
MVPDDVSANWRALGAAGHYDRYARRLAINLVEAGMGDAVIRLGHEMNGTWYHDSLGNNPAQYRDWIEYWIRIVRAMRSVQGAHFLFDWNINAGYQDIPLNSYYPGSGVVDVIGIDNYDSGMPGDSHDQAVRWARLDSEGSGLAQIVAFARAHGKPLSVPEWGLINSASGGAGDDPAYIRGIAAAVRDNNVVFHVYFDRPSGGVLLIQKAPKSLSLWKEYFGSRGTEPGTPWPS